jgi:predicted MPP superfamily phosphohydrolase
MARIVAAANGGFVSGLYRVGSMWLYVSNGTGQWSYIALRLFTPSEISLIRLTRAVSE